MTMKRTALLIGEMGLAHGGDLDRAKRILSLHANRGAGGIKIQAFQVERLYARAETSPEVWDLFTRYATPYDWIEELALLAIQEGTGFYGTPFDSDAARRLAEAGAEAIKVASGDITNAPLLDAVGRTDLPVLLSTGASTIDEVTWAAARLDAAGAKEVTLLQCVSAYPCPKEEAGLAGIAALAALGRPVGYSDHTIGVSSAVEAARLGACVIEKHVTDDRKIPGPDQELALEPLETAELARALWEIPISPPAAKGEKRVRKIEEGARVNARRGLYSVRDLRAGQVLEPGDLVPLRPAKGLPASFDFTGKKLRRACPAGRGLLPEMIED